jgi:hypothetical protein
MKRTLKDAAEALAICAVLAAPAFALAWYASHKWRRS